MDRHKNLSDRYFGHDHVTIIEPHTGWRLLDWRELWAYRELLFVLTLRDIKVRYKQTVLGSAWAIIQPVMMMVVFSIFFGGLAKMPSDGFPYPIFVYSGLLPWTFFANAITSSANSVIGASNLVSKVYFPRLIIPLSSIGSSLVDFAIAAAILARWRSPVLSIISAHRTWPQIGGDPASPHVLLWCQLDAESSRGADSRVRRGADCTRRGNIPGGSERRLS